MARIIHERGLTGTAIGTMALAAGAMDDVAAWLIFAVVVASFKHDAMVAIVAFGGALGYAALVFGPLRPYLRRLAREADAAGEVTQSAFGAILLLLMLGAWFTDWAGVHSVFGAFILGAAVPRGRLTRELQRMIGPVTMGLFLPLFFVYSGLHTRIGLVSTTSMWLITPGSSSSPARQGRRLLAGGAPERVSQSEALGIGTLMNARDDGADPPQHRPRSRADHADAVHHPGADDARHDADGDAPLRPRLSPRRLPGHRRRRRNGARRLSADASARRRRPAPRTTRPTLR